MSSSRFVKHLAGDSALSESPWGWLEHLRDIPDGSRAIAGGEAWVRCQAWLGRAALEPAMNALAVPGVDRPEVLMQRPFFGPDETELERDREKWGDQQRRK